MAGPREIKEELGLDVGFDELTPVGRRIFVHCFSPGTRECEFQDVFLLHRDLELKDLVLQQDELDGVVQLDIEKGIALFSGGIDAIEAPYIDPSGTRSTVLVSPDSFVPCLDRYYLKLLLVAQRYSQGERRLLAV